MPKDNINPDTGAILMQLDEQTKTWIEGLVSTAVGRIVTAMNSAAMVAPQPAARAPAPSTGGQRSNGGPTAFPNYGRSKGAPISGATTGDLEFYANGARRSLADPAKSRWHDSERALLTALETEIQRQTSGGSSPQTHEEPPPPSGGPDESDLPF